MTLIKDIINQNKRLANISKAISELSDETNINAFLVGGCVRDLMLNPLEEAIDVDIMVEGNGIDFAKKLAKKINVPKVVPFEKFATAKIPYNKFEIEVASARLEKYEESSRNPSEVVISKIEDDLLRRDFTVNAIYMDEKVPKITPKIIANEKPFKISPPKKNIDNKANKVVIEVIRVLDKVSFIDVLVNSKIFISEYFLRFSLTLSYITTVSFME